MAQKFRNQSESLVGTYREIQNLLADIYDLDAQSYIAWAKYQERRDTLDATIPIELKHDLDSWSDEQFMAFYEAQITLYSKLIYFENKMADKHKEISEKYTSLNDKELSAFYKNQRECYSVRFEQNRRSFEKAALALFARRSARL